MKSMLKIGSTLFAICAIASMLLAFTNSATAPVIEDLNVRTNNELRQKVLPTANEFVAVDESKIANVGDGIVAEAYEGKDGDKVTGYTMKVLPKGYGGSVEVIVGIDVDGKITGVDIGNMTETPGLGAKAKEPAFKGQYTDKEAKELEVVKGATTADNQILAISGATITSKAVTTGVNAAIDAYNALKQ